MEKLPGGGIYVTKGSTLPYLCPRCDSIVPYTKSQIQKCWSCDYEVPTEEFEVEWEFKSSQ